MGSRRRPDENLLVKDELDRLTQIFTGFDENKWSFVRRHIEQLAWYNVKIRELQKSVSANGITLLYKNGANQYGTQANPELRALIDLQKLASAMVKILLPLVPEKPAVDELAEFMAQFDCD